MPKTAERSDALDYPSDWIDPTFGSLKSDMAKCGCFTEQDILDYMVYHNRRVANGNYEIDEREAYVRARRQLMVSKFIDAQRNWYRQELDLWSDSHYYFEKVTPARSNNFLLNPDRLIDQGLIVPLRITDGCVYIDQEIQDTPISGMFVKPASMSNEPMFHPLDMVGNNNRH